VDKVTQFQLHIDQLCAGYGQSQVLQGVSLGIAAGEIVALLGRNGAGRSTLAKAIMGLVPAQGSITWRGESLLGKKTFEIARFGLGYVPESRDVFPDLTVLQNLLLGQKSSGLPARWALDDMFNLFPQLKARAAVRAGVLSGGEQQMLTLCRTLMGDPALIIIDEPTEGLAPQLVQAVADFLNVLKARGISVLLIEQKLTIALDVADRCAVMGHGRLVFDGTSDALRHDSTLCRQWLQV
jgi:branched-chain amino acid transport system ATP-binding protein